MERLFLGLQNREPKVDGSLKPPAQVKKPSEQKAKVNNEKVDAKPLPRSFFSGGFAGMCTRICFYLGVFLAFCMVIFVLPPLWRWYQTNQILSAGFDMVG
jgi:hypothetical protein